MPKINNKTENSIPNKSNKTSERRPSVNSSTRKDVNKSANSKDKNQQTNLKLDKENNNSFKKQEKDQKQIKIIDNSLDNADAMDLIDIIQNKTNENNNRDITNENIKNNNFQNRLQKAEIKITPNINEINNLIADSQQALNQQKNLLENISELNKKLSASEFEVQKMTGKLDSEEFSSFSDKYSESLDKVIVKLKNHSEEMENIKCK